MVPLAPRRRPHRRLGVARRPVRPPPAHPGEAPHPAHLRQPGAGRGERRRPRRPARRRWPGSTSSPACSTAEPSSSGSTTSCSGPAAATGAGHRRDVRPRPVQGAQRRPRPPGRRRRPPQLHPDPRAERPRVRRGRAASVATSSRSILVGADAGDVAAHPRSDRHHPRVRTRRRWARCGPATARPGARRRLDARRRSSRRPTAASTTTSAAATIGHPHIALVEDVLSRYTQSSSGASSSSTTRRRSGTTSGPRPRCRTWRGAGAARRARDDDRCAPHCASRRSAPASSAPLAVST